MEATTKRCCTIVDSHVTTLITGVALFLFGTGPIKGFAVTLCLGIAINLFTALVGTKVIFDIINQRHKVEQLSTVLRVICDPALGADLKEPAC